MTCKPIHAATLVHYAKLVVAVKVKEATAFGERAAAAIEAESSKPQGDQ